HAVVLDLEIGGFEVAHRFAVIAHEHVDADDLPARAEDGLTGGQRDDRERHTQDHRRPASDHWPNHHLAPVRRAFTTSDNKPSASRPWVWSYSSQGSSFAFRCRGR